MGGVEKKVFEHLFKNAAGDHFVTNMIITINQVLFSIPLILFNSLLWGNYTDDDAVSKDFLKTVDIMITVMLSLQTIYIMANIATLSDH